MLIVVRLKKRWMTLETGKAGDANEPEVEHGDNDEEEEEKPSKFRLGFGTEVSQFVSADPSRGDPALPELRGMRS